MIEAIPSKNGKTYWVEQGDALYKKRLRHGQYQSKNWDFAQTVLQGSRRCIDVGSNNAVNAIHYAERFAWVECFEPTPLAQTLWHNTVRDNGVTNVTLHTQALGEDTRDTFVILHERNGGHNHLSHYDKNPRTNIKNLGRRTTPCEQRTLDSYAFEDVDFVKIDVEGYELFVLQGAEQTLENNRPLLQLEIVENQCRKFDYTPDDILDWLRALDYACVSKKRGWIEGAWSKHRGDMDLFFVPCEWNTKLEPSKELFDFG